jgi:EAL domain-containing protein (putative c-di-GMP-specific phosphodiesterase class I)/GGDEF domain-containing protein
MASKSQFSRLEEKRRQTRLAVSQPARMILDSGRELICEIADFCLGGLFLRYAIPERDGKLVEEQEGKPLRVSFTTSAALGGQTHDFAVKLVRQSETGVGVAFDETPVAAVLALNKVAAEIRSQKAAVKLYGGVDISELKLVCKRHLKQAMADGFARFAETIIPRLEGASAASRSLAEQSEILDALWQIHPAISEVSYRSLSTMLGRLDSLGMGVAAAGEGLTSRDLSIVGKEEFEDWISVTTVSNKLADRFSAELGVLELRLERVYGLKLDARNNPFGPAVILNDIKQAFAELSLPLPVRLIVDAVMHDALVEPLAALYRGLLGTLPEAESEKTLPSPIAGRPAPMPLQRGEVPVSLGSVASSIVSHARQGEPGQADMVALPASALGMLTELLAHGKIPPSRREEATVSADVFGKLLNAISAEKSLPAEVLPQFLQLEDALLRLALLDPSYLNNPAHPAHAALNAMDRLSLVSSDDGRIDDDRVLKHIGQWTERIRNEADGNPAVFEEVRVQAEKVLQPMIKERSARIAKLQAALEGWQKTGQASRLVLTRLEERVAGKNVPAVVLDLFASGWRNYLIRVVMRHGEASAEATEAWRVVDNLLDWLGMERRKEPSYQGIQHLLQEVDSRLKLVCPDRDVQDRLVERLTKVLLKQESTSYRPVTRILPPQPSAPGSTEGEQGEEDPLETFRVGDWVNFDGMSVPLNLIWIGDEPESYVFCNYKGVKKLELSRGEFMQRILAGTAKLAENLDLPLMDRSFSSMIQHIHQDLLKRATIDEKTGLADRREFMRRARERLLFVDASPEGEDCKQVMGVLDIESMRVLRTRLGEEGYAEMTRALALHLEGVLEPGLLTQSTEYTFAFMLPVTSVEQMQSMGEKIISEINRFSFKRDGSTYTLSANLGLVCSGLSRNPEELYSRADEACLEAKHRGRNQIVAMQAEAEGSSGHSWLDEWSNRLTEWLQGGHFSLRCQPIVDAASDALAISHYEILLGVHPDGGKKVNIGELMAAVEQLGRATEIDKWVVRSVFDWMRQNPGRLENSNGLSINLSAQSINSRNFLDFLSAELDRADIPGDKLIFEITESAAIGSFAHAERFIRQIRRYGCGFALDDFGVGFSSFSYLKNLKVDFLKIDGSFVRNMNQNEIDVALVSSMHETSRFLGIKTVAEMVEDRETLDILRRIGVNFVQGYHLGKPLPIDDSAF